MTLLERIEALEERVKALEQVQKAIDLVNDDDELAQLGAGFDNYGKTNT